MYPNALEVCNGIDDNCNELIDEDEFGEDADGDLVRNLCDNCRFVFNPSQLDTDGDVVGNSCDNCIFVSNPDQADEDSDEHGDVCDNCPRDSNPSQDDYEPDGHGDVCDNCVFVRNVSQSDVDGDFEGDYCDLDDGLIYLLTDAPNYVQWDEEQGYTSWNLYRGDLTTLVDTGVYTQAPGSNPLAGQECGLGEVFVEDLSVPEPGRVAFYLTTGVNGAESDLGMDSAGTSRPNGSPCP